MNFFGANLAVLQKHHPETAARISGLSSAEPRGVWSVSRNGFPAVRLGSTALTSAFDPQAEADKAVPEWDETADFALLVGLGAGYLAEAVVRRYPDLPLVIAEEDPAWFAEVLGRRNLTDLWANPRVIPLLGPHAQVVGTFFRSLACRTIEVLAWRPLAQLSPDWGRAVAAEAAQAQAEAGVNVATLRRFGGLWRRNLVKNEAHAQRVRPLTALAGWADGVPAVVAAAGPSLADAFGWMREHRRRFLLIAVDTAWSALAAQGFEPDLLLVLDGQYWNSRHVDRTPPPNTLVVTEWIGPPRAFRLAPGRTYTAASSVPILRLREQERWGDLGALPTGGSVATAAWSLALHLGCPEVAFAGLDLGYPRGQTHVPGSQFEEAVHRRSHRLCPAETSGLGLRGPGLVSRPALDGGQVLSDPRMDLFRRWLSAAAAGHPEVKAVNLGRRGSVVPGLIAAGEGYGDGWPERKLAAPADAPYLVPRPARPDARAFEALARVFLGDDFAGAVEAAWAEARRAWGAPLWDGWAGRAKATWDLWPSSRSRRAVEEVAALAREWEGFWEFPSGFLKRDSRIRDVSRE